MQLGRLNKRHNLLGYFLNATFHSTKNTPISQRISPFGIGSMSVGSEKNIMNFWKGEG